MLRPIAPEVGVLPWKFKLLAPIPNRNAWLPRPEDLPSEETLKCAPILRDLENNVVYRSMLFGRRTRRSMPRFESSTGMAVLLLGSVVLLSCFGPLFFFVAFPLSRYFRKPQANVIAFFGMPEVLLRELIEMRVPAPEWSIALWGRTASPHAQRRMRGWIYLGITLLIGYAFLLLSPQPGVIGAAAHASIAMFLGVRFGLALGCARSDAHAMLPGLLGRVRRFRTMTLLANNPLGWMYALALLLGLGLILLTATMILTFAAFGFSRAFPGLLAAISAGSGFIPLSTILLPLFTGLLLGHVITAVRSRRTRLFAETWLRAIDEEVDGMLKIMQSRLDFEGDERPNIPRLNFRPAGTSPDRPGREPLAVLSSGSEASEPRDLSSPESGENLGSTL